MFSWFQSKKTEPEVHVDYGKLVREKHEQFRQRRRTQMMYFFGATAATLVFSRLAYRGVQAHVPGLFNSNHVPPPFSFQQDAISAIALSTVLSVSSFSMGVTGVAWTWDVSNVKEFTYKLKQKLGGVESEKQISETKLDDESVTLQDAINAFINGEGFEDDPVETAPLKQ
ncbi:putative membrane protein [Wickerhamomyces ciferrii]|uniref:Altered inheritance of mitochondria protein 11 n=1 Tax=Wickerhamomyces ciferrii (strain ATCC 14091 / BCRC 22168 / CBS 111 / JCM 3599 / NBRC 0793 / NRRL Y-1031 F-60-10) TaxID=1206466 RepID=K0KT22_WICCF|nr:uncharacterized protein BN7_4773 [Wickerhamomyces ciferrii]CCH45192.1 putative membrane protein [Wickerhamomyces ciferrii]